VLSRSSMKRTLTPKNWESNSKWWQSIGLFIICNVNAPPPVSSRCVLSFKCAFGLQKHGLMIWLNQCIVYNCWFCMHVAYTAGWCTERWAPACCYKLCSSTAGNNNSIQHNTKASRDCGFILLGSEQRNKMNSVGVEGCTGMAVVHMVPFMVPFACNIQWGDFKSCITNWSFSRSCIIQSD